jgi:hypothetical protein
MKMRWPVRINGAIAMIVCEHVDVLGTKSGEFNTEVYFADGWDGSSGATQWCKEMRARFPDPQAHKVYAYEAVKF